MELVAPRRERAATDESDATAEPNPARPTPRRIDVTHLDAQGVQEYVQQNVATDQVSLEHRGARTYLLVEE